jgi:hypothetical protein
LATQNLSNFEVARQNPIREMCREDCPRGRGVGGEGAHGPRPTAPENAWRAQQNVPPRNGSFAPISSAPSYAAPWRRCFRRRSPSTSHSLAEALASHRFRIFFTSQPLAHHGTDAVVQVRLAALIHSRQGDQTPWQKVE